MIAIENRNGLMCSYDTAAKDFQTYGTPEEMREALIAAGVFRVYYRPEAPWKSPRPSGDASRASDFRHSAGSSQLGGSSAWKAVPIEWIGDGESIEARCV